MRLPTFRRMLWSLSAAALVAAVAGAQEGAQETARLAPQDPRFKADILLVVAHPDDEGAATPYLARAIDQGKRVAVAYGTRGSSGANEFSAEQAAALGTVREIEAREACAKLGIRNVWFLGGKDTASQDVLQSLANWEHGAALENLIRVVRLTRPEVILTFLPGTFIGEDHGDHQAAGVVATEAFDAAGDPAVFPAQVAVPVRRLEPYLENLRPWQAKKIYYFPDAERDDLFRDLGPSYSVKDVSKAANKPYWRIAMESWLIHKTQAQNYINRLSKMSETQIEKLAETDGWGDAQHFVLGKSLVGGDPRGEIFENIQPGAIAFAPPERSAAPAQPELSVSLAGPWSFYAEFRRAHALTHLPHPEPPEIALQGGTTLVVPLRIHNATESDEEITLSADLPQGWTAQSGLGKLLAAAHQDGSARVEIALPPLGEKSPPKMPAGEVSIRAEAAGRNLGSLKIRVELRKRTLPE